MALVRRHIGHISVESGRLVLVDPIFLKRWRAGEFQEEVPGFLNSYDEACKITLKEPWYGWMLDGEALVVSPPDGDDQYPVYGYFTEDGLCVKLDVVLSLEAADWNDLLEWELSQIKGEANGAE